MFHGQSRYRCPCCRWRAITIPGTVCLPVSARLRATLKPCSAFKSLLGFLSSFLEQKPRSLGTSAANSGETVLQSLHLRVIAINFIAINYSSPLSLVLHTECFWKIYSKNIFSDYRGRKVCICLFDNFGRCVSQFRQLGTHTSTCAHVCTLSGNNIGDLKHCNNCRVEINWCSADVCLTIRLFFSR